MQGGTYFFLMRLIWNAAINFFKIKMSCNYCFQSHSLSERLLKSVILKQTVKTKICRKEAYLDPPLKNPHAKGIFIKSRLNVQKTKKINLTVNVTAMACVIAGKFQALTFSKPLFPYLIEQEWCLTRIVLSFSISQCWNDIVSCIIHVQYVVLYRKVIDRENSLLSI